MDDVAAVVERELGERPGTVRRIEEGLIHDSFAVRCDGDAYVVQRSRDHGDLGNPLGHGLACYLALADADVPVPGVVTDEPVEFDGRRYAVVERLPGETGERNVSPERVRNAGRCLARIHRQRTFDEAGWFSLDGGDPGDRSFDGDAVTVHGFDEGSLAGRSRRKLAENGDRLREFGLETAGRRLPDPFDRERPDLPGTFEPVLCHGDFTPDNVLFEGDAVSGVVDFDFARAGHAHRDLALAANGFWMHDPCADWDVRRTLYDGYREVRSLDGSFERTEPLYRVETLADVVASLLEMGELSAGEREFYAERLVAAIDRAEGA